MTGFIFEFPKVERGIPFPYDPENDKRRQRPTRTTAQRLALEAFLRNRKRGESFIFPNHKVGGVLAAARRIGVMCMSHREGEWNHHKSRVWIIREAE